MSPCAFTDWREELLRSGATPPLVFGDVQDKVIATFGAPDDVSVKNKGGQSVILRYSDIEFHFAPPEGLVLIYGERDDGTPLVSISAT